jgi:hypothetical protein
MLLVALNLAFTGGVVFRANLLRKRSLTETGNELYSPVCSGSICPLFWSLLPSHLSKRKFVAPLHAL